MTFTEKQKELLRIFKNGELKRINILHGSVRSGKTWISLVLWAFWVASSPADKAYLMVAKTLASLKRNCLDLLEELVGSKNFQYSTGNKEGWLFGRRVYLEGVNDVRAESKIRGMTLQGAYCDELTLFTEDFFVMLLYRLSEPGAKLIGTTNPDAPTHWLKMKYIDRKDKLSLLDMKFLIDDNTTLEPEFVKQIKAENTGVFYDRFILGKWVTAEGLIYKILADNPKKYLINKKDVPDIRRAYVGLDFGGNKSNHAIVCSGIGTDGKLYFLKARCKKATGTDADELINWCNVVFDECYKDLGIYFDVYADNAEQVLINSISRKTRFSMYNAIKSPINDRIRCLNILLATGRALFVEGETDELVKALSDAVWDDKKMVDTRLDNGTFNNDVIDAAEYSFEYEMDRLVNLYVLSDMGLD